MKTTLLFLLPVIAIMTACGPDALAPVANFTFRDQTQSTFAMGTYDTCTLFNQSLHTHAVHWDLGDGRSSDDPKLLLSYDQSGTYKVTLTATGDDGQVSTVSKTVTIKDRVLRSIQISSVYWKEENTNGWPTSSKADIFLQIQKYTDTEMTEGYLCATCPVLYTSSVVHDVASHTTTPITIQVPERVVIDKKLINFAFPDYLNNAYLAMLMAKDEDGKVYCLQSNRGGGSYFGVLRESFANNEFIVQNGLFSDYVLVCDFE